jgi:pre-rRNA-processing protein TSR1
MTPQTRPGILKSLLSFTTYFFPSITKIHVVPTQPDASSSDANNLARSVLEGVPAGASSASMERGGAGIKGRGRDGRGWLVAETGDCRSGEESEAIRYELDGEGEKGTLSVTGTVRGARLSADRLVHIPGWGDYQVESITSAPLSKHSHRAHSKEMNLDESTGAVLSTPGEEADDLTALNEVDTMGNEQTWPTEEEMADGEAIMRQNNGEADGAKKIRVKRVPKGTSAYQAAWILDDEDEAELDRENDDDDEMAQDNGDDLDEVGVEAGFGRVRDDEEELEETEEIELDERRVEDEELDDEEEERQSVHYDGRD